MKVNSCFLTVGHLVLATCIACAPSNSGPTATDVADPPLPELAEADREYLWDLEHHGNVLSQIGLRKIGESICQDQQEQLQHVLGANFTAEVLDNPQQIEFASAALSAQRENDTRYQSFNAQEFSEWLLGYKRRFAGTPRSRFDIMKLTPPSSENYAGTWTISCLLRLWGTAEESSEQSGPLEITMRCLLEVEQPTKNRVQEQGWLLTWKTEQISSAAAKDYLFREVTKERLQNVYPMHDNWLSLDKVVDTGGIYACDYNRDGWVDLFVTDLNNGVQADVSPYRYTLFAGGPNGDFTDVTEKAGLTPDSDRAGLTAAFFDLDNDGWEDLILPQFTGLVYRNYKGKFIEAPKWSNLLEVLKPHLGITALIPADFDRDGLTDLYVTRHREPTGSWLEKTMPRGPANQLLRNKGNGQFEDVTDQMSVNGGGRSVFTAGWLDANNDSWPDLYVINEFGNGLYLENQEGKTFRSRELIDGPADFGSMGLSCGDFDNDGQIDIYVSNMYSKAGSRVMSNLPDRCYSNEITDQLRTLVAGSELYRNVDGQFQRVGKGFQVHAIGWAWGSAMADLNNDGWLDLYATAGFMSRNRSKPDG